MSSPPPSVPGEVRTFLQLTRTLSLVWILLSGLVVLVGLLELFFALLFLHLSIDGLWLVIYGGLSGFTSLFIRQRIPSWMEMARKDERLPLRESLLLWAVLGLVFGVLLGILLLLAYLRLEGPEGSSAGSTPAMSGPPAPPPPAGAEPVPAKEDRT